MNKVLELLKNKPYLTWYIKDKSNLSPESALEHILNYGNWEDYLVVEKNLGIRKVNALFQKLKNRKRANLRPQTINYFSHYLTKYA